MASVSFNTKNMNMYCKFTDSGYNTVHLGKSKSDSIKALKRTWDLRQYIKDGIYTSEKLEQLIKRIDDNMNR